MKSSSTTVLGHVRWPVRRSVGAGREDLTLRRLLPDLLWCRPPSAPTSSTRCVRGARASGLAGERAGRPASRSPIHATTAVVAASGRSKWPACGQVRSSRVSPSWHSRWTRVRVAAEVTRPLTWTMRARGGIGTLSISKPALRAAACGGRPRAGGSTTAPARACPYRHDASRPYNTNRHYPTTVSNMDNTGILSEAYLCAFIPLSSLLSLA